MQSGRLGSRARGTREVWTMIEATLSDSQKKLRSEVRDFVKSVPRQLILDLDAEKVTYPKEYLQEAARRKLLGLRFPAEWSGRGLDWRHEIVALEEIGTLPMSLACLYSLVSICGQEYHIFGTEAQKEK